MEQLIYSIINWENYKNLEKDKCKIEVSSAEVSKSTKVLLLVLKVNFMVDQEDLNNIRHALYDKFPELSGIKIEIEFGNMAEAIIQVEKENSPKKRARVKKERKVKFNNGKTINAHTDDICIVGKPIDVEATPINELFTDMVDVVVKGDIVNLKSREIIGKKSYGGKPPQNSTVITMDVSDYTDTIPVKIFVAEEVTKKFLDILKVDSTIKVQGKLEYDPFEKENLIKARDIEYAQKNKRQDNADKKRVELHVHTKMSALDGFSDIGAVIETAADWGHDAIAITDHAVIYAFPDAYAHGQKRNVKVILGVEGYLVDDTATEENDGKIDYKTNPSNHVILLVENQVGLKNLYNLISIAHTEFFYRKPRIPKSILNKHRKGLLVGAACQDGEVFQSILHKRTEEEILEIAKFYDYLEVQPIINNEFLIKRELVKSRDELIEINKKIVSMGEELNKLVVATCDVHYINPHEGLYRTILMSVQGYEDVESEDGLYLRTTEEMLEEFSYLGKEKAYEIVVENTNKIAKKIKNLSPVPPDRFPPHIEGAEEDLRKMCVDNAKQIYGETLPDIVDKRLKKELDSIIGNGYAVMYIISQKLVAKSLEAGYVVGSRGSVGSSFVATMSGITEVNPLPPHYVCPNCKHSDFDVDIDEYGCGADLPDKKCPDCDSNYNKDGFDIPFEVFLGFEGNKEPDIDLNFAGEYQATAHKYVDELFGKENVYKAGIITTLGDKSAFGFVMKYLDERNESKSRAEVGRLAKALMGVRKSSGQHPGGVVILPKGCDIHDICPVQYPANKKDTGIKTTHFDFHSLEQNLFKLDILGHDAPSMIRMLNDMTGIDPQTVPLRDKKVDSLFINTKALNFSKGNFKIKKGSLGIPELGTKFVREMLEDTKPQSIADLVRVSGFSHGTDVWLNNAKDLILSRKVALKDAISTRDDIMKALINKGVDPQISFKIMESVRKGYGITEEWENAMKEKNVPDWYAKTFKRISYMFPKAHAVAYILMAYRIAYFKVYYPQSFYAAYFSTKVEDFNLEVILEGFESIENRISEIEAKGKDAKGKEESELTVLEIAYEMLCRGYEFENVILGTSDPMKFKILNDKVLLPFASIPGIGEAAANSLVSELEKGEFNSVEELLKRTIVNRTAVEKLKGYGVLAGIPDSDQLSFL